MMGGNSGSSSGGSSSSSSGGGFWGAIASAAIGAGSTAYSAYKAKGAQEDADKKMRDAKAASDARQEEIMNESLARQDALAADNALREQEGLTPIGESATISFGNRQNETTGSSLDFLVPKVGKSQLGGQSTSGLGV